MPDQLNHDFDFLFGAWRVEHSRLKERFQACDAWDTFEGTSTTRPILGGNGNIEDNVLNLPDGAYRAAAIRAFDADARNWSIWWLDGRYPGTLDVPVVGRFENGVGTFLTDDTLAGKPIKVQFLWSHIEAHACRWQQSFSQDGGTTWETNWIMHFTRMTAPGP